METYTFEGYAQTVVNQPDMAYRGKRNDWDNPENAQGNNDGTYAKGYYTKVKSTYKKPHRLYAYDFGCDIPSEAVIVSMRFDVKLRHTGNLNVKKPKGSFLLYDVVNRQQNVSSPDKTGWYNGVYSMVLEKTISETWGTASYTISKENLKKFTDLNNKIDSQAFGLFLEFRDANSTGQIRIKHIKLTVEYYLPQRIASYDNVSIDSDNPTPIGIDNFVEIQLSSHNISSAPDTGATYVIDLPLGFEYSSASFNGNTVSFDPSTMEWKVKGGKVSNTPAKLTIFAITRASGLKEVRVFDEMGTPKRGYFFVESDRIVGFDEILCTPHDMRRGELSCVDFAIRSQSSSARYSFTVHIPDLNGINDVYSAELIAGNTSEDVSLTDITYNTGSVGFSLSVTPNEEFYVGVKICYYPRNDGNQTINVQTSNELNKNFTVAIGEAYQKTIIFNTENDGSCSQLIEVANNRFITLVEGDLAVIPIYTEDYDGDMYVDESTFSLNQWKKTRYIGCVEVPYAHYDPKHTSKDKLLDEHYKNKQYLGKENTVDEDITLSIKVPRRKVPTLIGLVNIDKPIPINLVPDAFENDPLNHRGWVEIYGIEVTPTNPLYDTCEIDVKYITHNIISRFNISTGELVNKFSLPDLYSSSLSNGEDIGEFFDVTTDGSYVFDDENINHQRNLFSISNQQDVLLRSKSPLASKCQFEMYWDTVKFPELRENDISRVIRLVDSTGRTVFEYEFYDFDFSEEVYSCRVLGRVLTDNGFDPQINTDIYIHSDVEFTDDETDEEYDSESLDVYGSSTSFELDSNKLTILEQGFSGYEFERTIELLTGTYYLEVYWKNNNNDDDTGNSISYFDFNISELSLNPALSEYYNKLLVSPYPIPNKKIVFTRESEEGTIYYLENDGEEFNFLLEPFYQYKCGVDLVAEGSSIFDFNNSYPIIYLQNGLIRFGINRLNGDLYLDKYDAQSKEYIRTNRFRIDKFDDAEVTQISDDTITVEVSDITITMWRGRPYVMLQHETEDIHILNGFTQAFAEGIGESDVASYPLIFDLANSKNLLPECVGGTQLLKSSCISVWEDDTVLNDLGDFIIAPNKTECYLGEDIVCTLLSTFDDGEVSLIVNGDVVATNIGNTITGTLDTAGTNVIYAVYHGNDTTNMEISNIVAVNVVETVGTGGWKLECITTDTTINYNQGTVDFQLTYDGVGMGGIEVSVYNAHQTWHITTDENGIVRSKNRQVPVGKQKWEATAYDGGQQLDATCVKTLEVLWSTPYLYGRTLSMKKGENAVFRLVQETKEYSSQTGKYEYVPMSNVKLEINIGGTKYWRTTNSSGNASVKMSKKGTYDARVVYAGETKKYKPVIESFTVVVK